MSVGDLHDVERPGDLTVVSTRIRRRPPASQTLIERAHRTSGPVPITVLTRDSALADAIHDAAASTHPVATATTLDEALELAAHGRCGILITDQVATQPVLRRMTQRLRETEPALVVIAVGGADDQNGLISLLSAGVADRLMLKPVTPHLAQIVLKSAAQQHRTLQGSGSEVTLIDEREPAVVLVELQRDAANQVSETKLDQELSPAEVVIPASAVTPVNSSRRIDIPRPPWFVVAAALLAVAGLMWWIAGNHKPFIDAQAVIASNLAAGQQAFREGRSLEPRGRSAFDHYSTVLALDPANGAARQGIDQIADRFASQAGTEIARGQLAAAIVDIESIERVRPDHPQLLELQALLDLAQAKLVAAMRERAEPAPQPTPKAAPPKSPSLEQSVINARARTVSQASDALKRDQLELAGALLTEARALGVPAADLKGLDQSLASAQQQREMEERLHLAKAEQSFDEASRTLPSSIEIGAGANLPMVVEPAAPAPPELPKPKLARMVKPEYPQDALLTGAEGWVNVSMSVTPAGKVIDPRVAESSNGTLFDRAAISAVRKWKYEPFAASDPQHVIVRVDFRMKGGR